MNVYRSNRVERLLDPLARVVGGPTTDLVTPQRVVVNSKGMERWLAMQLAQRLGVCANLEFPFPFRVLHDAFKLALGARAERLDAWTQEPLAWALLAVLPPLLEREEFAPLRRYVDGDPLKLQQLCRRIASTFDRYVLYRYDKVRLWESGREEHWQAVLWRALADRIPHPHLGRLERPFFDQMVSGARLPQAPGPLCVFGVSSLPPLVLRVLAVLSRQAPVHLFLLCPSDQYWADLHSRRRRDRFERLFELPSEDLHVEVGHPLLASLGRLGQDFQRVLEEHADYHEPDPDLFVRPSGSTMLSQLQADIMDLVDPSENPPLPLASSDRSIAVHSCHGRIRQVEVLQDQLLDLFKRHPDLQPRDVVVMMPDVETWSPLVHAVFDRSRDDERFIPYRVADRSLRRDNPVADALLSVLGLADSRMSASQVLDLLAHDPVRERFGVLPTDLEEVAEWVHAAGVRWGIDGAHRERFGQPAADGLNTWRFGLDRLLVGSAVPGSGLWQEVLPYDEIEGQATRLLGALVEFCESLFEATERLRRPRTPKEWERELGRLLDALLVNTEDNAWMHLQVRSRLEQMVAHSDAAAFDEPLDVDQIRAWLAELFDERVPASGFLSGQLTFCAMVPMRTIPFRVICLLGMDEGEYPRRHVRMGFDLLQQEQRPGDRNPREDDRYLFLETLLSARDALVITYAGRSIRDNKERPPSVLVTELLDSLQERFQGVDDQVHVVHPLQPFSAACFDPSSARPLRSFDRSALRGALRRREPSQPPPPLFTGPLPAVPEDERRLSVADLLSFLSLPTRHLLQRRLGVRMAEEEEAASDREPLVLDALDRWKVAAPLLEQAVASEDLEQAYRVVKRRGVLPLGVPGECTFEELRSLVEVVADVVTREQEALGHRVDPEPVDLVLEDGRLSGTLGPLRQRGILKATWSKLAAKHLLEGWVLHLVQCAVLGPRPTVVVGRHPEAPGALKASFEPVPDAEKRLSLLVRMYWRNWQIPLPFFPRTSLKYQREAGLTNESMEIDKALGRCRWVWSGRFGEREDPYITRVFAGHDPLDPQWSWPELDIPALGFHKYARFVYQPMLDAMTETSVKA